MWATVITIGDELLIGQVADTNSSWIARKLNGFGVRAAYFLSVGDDRTEITEAVETAMRKSDIVLITGGLGPTKDDLTKYALAEIFGCPVEEHEPTTEMNRRMLAARGIEFNELNRSQSFVPACCTVLPNHNGTAPGMWFERGGTVVVSLPGVPFEMEAIMETEVLPRIGERFNLSAIVHKTMVTFGIAESILAEKIAGWENSLPGHLRLAYLPGPEGIRLRLSAYEVISKDVMPEIDRRFAELETIIPRHIVGYGDASLESVAGEILKRRGETLAVAESCTGGAIAGRITMQAGASEYFKGGVVAYANDVKEKLLGVRRETLERYGAVSRETAVEMAEGVRRVCGSTYGVSTTGVAGPTGGTPEKSVGTVWIAVAAPEGVVARKMTFGSLREPNIRRAAASALDLLRLVLTGAEEVASRTAL